MSFKETLKRHRKRLVSALLSVLVIVLLVVFRGPIIAWFSLEPMASGTEKGSGTKASAGPFSLEVGFVKDPPREKGNALRIRVEDASGKPVEDAQVEAEYSMPAMGGMPEMRGKADVEALGDGAYRAEFDLPMGGSWTLEVDVEKGDKSGSVPFSFTVGSSGLTAKGGGGAMADDKPKAPELPPLELSAPALAAMQEALAAYEGARALLARDRIEGLEAHARRLATSLRTAASSLSDVPSAVSDCLAQGAAAAERLAGAKSLEEARQHFGEMSRFLVALVASAPRLQEGKHVFSCPMAEGYGKWIQPTKSLENPYMGQKMLTCGSASRWQEAKPEAAVVSHEGHGHEGSDPAHYTCSMHPSVKQEGPGTCPICAMDLTPVTYDEKEGGVILIDDARRQKIGVRTERIGRAPMELDFRAVGKVAIDESRVEVFTPKVKGYVTRLFADETGKPIKKGQPLLSIYSPELHAAQAEYLLALGARGSGADPSGSLLRASRKRLELLDVPKGQIAALEKRDEPFESITFTSPASGYVLEKNVVEGAAVEPGQPLFRIADLDKIWIDAEVYESDLPKVKKGQPVKIELPYVPGKTYEGKIAYVYPTLSEATRTGRVRIELKNPELELKPDMYANVLFDLESAERLRVPESAVVYTGPRRLVFVDLGEGRLRPQEVELGTKANGHYEVFSGLREGDVVVTSGNFLVAAESRIRSALPYWSGEEAPAAPPAAPSEAKPPAGVAPPGGVKP